MNNPYVSPGSQPEVATAEVVRAGWPRWLLMTFSLLGVLAFSSAAYMLLTQFVRLQAEFRELPPRFRESSRAFSDASWILGQFSVVASLACMLAIVLAARHRISIGWLLVGLSILVFVVLAFVLKPA